MAESKRKIQKSPGSSRCAVSSDLQISTRSVPRFTSFKPRQAAHSHDQNDHTSSISRPKLPGEEGVCHADYRPAQHKRRLKHERTDKTKGSLAAFAQNGRLPADLPSSKLGTGSADTGVVGHFTEDRQGDENNIMYGTSHRYSVPKYREAGRHGVLGLSRQFKTTTELEPGRRLVTIEHVDADGRQGTKSLRASSFNEAELMPLIPQLTADVEGETHRNYLSLSPRHDRKRRKLKNSYLRGNQIHQNNTEHSSGTPAEELDLESVSASSQSGFESESGPEFASSHPCSVRGRHIHLSREVNENPADVDAWLALIQHQDLMLAESGDGQTIRSINAQKRGLVDIKLSMYQKALSKTKGHPFQDQLVHGMMAEGAKIWDTKKLVREWRQALESYPNSLDLWIQYLNFRQTSFVTFTYESCREIFKDCLDMMAARQASVPLENTRVYIFLRMTVFMREAGFAEQAHALWQALLEYCFFKPSEDQANKDLSSFEDFWDSEVPRLGEEGARGWKMSERVQVEPRSDPPFETMVAQGLVANWAVEERQRMGTSILPARTLDEVAEDDPYRVILFSDIQPFLFRPASAEAEKQLVEAFLCFCGLQAPRRDVVSNHLPFTDPFLSNSFLNPSHVSLKDFFISSEPKELSHPHLSSFVIDTGSLFADGKHWFNPWAGLQAILSNKVRSDWMQRSLRQLVTTLPHDSSLAEWYIAFQSQLDIKTARTYAKSLLKQQTSLRLYNAFALLECSAGDFVAAERVWSTALSMHSSFPGASQQDMILVWRSWLWTLLARQDFSRALRLCLAVPEEKVTVEDLKQPGMRYLEEHPTSKLRAHQHLTSLLNQNLSLNHPNVCVYYTDVLSLLTYLTSNHSLAPSLTQYQTASTHPTIAQSCTALCLLHQSRARLLHLHAKTSPSGHRPSDITSPLAESIRLFPENTIFLSLYHLHTRRSLLIDRIRDVIPTLTATVDSSSSRTSMTASASSSASSASSIIPSLFHIWTELKRPTIAGGSGADHRIRSAFEKAVSSPDGDPTSSGQHSALIWKLYILWEMHVASSETPQSTNTTSTTSTTSSRSKGRPIMSSSSPDQTQIRMGRAISLLYRAIRACPWHKDLYMLAFRSKAPRKGKGRGMEVEMEMEMDMEMDRDMDMGVGNEELAAVYEMMVEKGLRVHVDLETGGKNVL